MRGSRSIDNSCCASQDHACQADINGAGMETDSLCLVKTGKAKRERCAP